LMMMRMRARVIVTEAKQRRVTSNLAQSACICPRVCR
jgi:hypothetical protein